MLLYPADISFADRFRSASQRARVITEAWVAQNLYCLACESDRLIPTTANTHARDFECDLCAHPYELKSSSKPFGYRIINGAYSSMMSRIRAGSPSNLLLLQYGSNWQVENLLAVHRLLITETTIQKRKPLSLAARRAGWVGCNILLANVPPEGRISLLASGQFVSKTEVRNQYAKTENLAYASPKSRGWASAVLTGLHGLGKQHFTIRDAYSLEPQLALLYPDNRHIRPKIRQQLQLLRDAGLISFQSRGTYSFTLKNLGGTGLVQNE